jgi:hypothetical protein
MSLGVPEPRDPITGEPKSSKKPRSSDRARLRDRPVSQLAEQSLRPVEEIEAWLEAGLLKGYRSPATGEWVVWGSQLDKWRQLLQENPR